MKRDRQRIDRALRGANPLDSEQLAALDLAAQEAALGERLFSEPALAEDVALPASPSRRRRSPRLIFVASLAVAATAVAILVATAASSSPQPAYGAELVRFAESTPLLLLEGPGWRVEEVSEEGHGRFLPRGSAGEGSMEFVTGKPIPDATVHVTQVGKPTHRPGSPVPVYTKVRESGMQPPAVRQRKVELRWYRGALAAAVEAAHRFPHPHGQAWTKLPVAGTSAEVDTRAEGYVNQGGPGNRQMTAYWSEDGYVLELQAAVPDLAAFEERLGWLTKVDSQAWLEAMPPTVVKAAEHGATVREMLKGIPVPAGFEPSLIPDEGVTTNRSQVVGRVTGTVACLWFRQWGEARRGGDRAAAAEAEREMASAKRWPVLRQSVRAGEGGIATTIWKLAEEMPSGYRVYAGRHWRLLPQAEAIGCARWGLPVLPWKQRLQRERGDGQTAAASS